jgi:hypothetical protein
MDVKPAPIVDRPGSTQDPAKVLGFKKYLQTGDLIEERADGYFVAKLLGALIPGFWSHTQIYVGTADDVRALDDDASVQALVKELAAKDKRLTGVTKFSALLAIVKPSVWAMLDSDECKKDGGVSIEALMSPDGPHQKSKSEVQFSSWKSTTSEHLAALRFRGPKRDIALMLLRAFDHLGDPFDAFDDYTSNTRWYCSKFAMHMWAPGNGMVQGLNVPTFKAGSFQAMFPNEIARFYDRTAKDPKRSLDFVAMLEKDTAYDPASANAEYLFRLSARSETDRYSWW